MVYENARNYSRKDLKLPRDYKLFVYRVLGMDSYEYFPVVAPDVQFAESYIRNYLKQNGYEDVFLTLFLVGTDFPVVVPGNNIASLF